MTEQQIQTASCYRFAMRKMFRSGARSLSGLTLLLAALNLASPAAVAQESTSALPSDPAAFMLRAAETNGLPLTGSLTWHLRISFRLFDQIGRAKDQGTIEEFYVSPTKFKKIYSSTGYFHTVFGTENGLMYTGDPAGPSPPIRPLLDVFVASIPVNLVKAGYPLTAEHRSINGADQLCIGMGAPSTADRPPLPHRTYCFDSATGVLQASTFDAFGNSQNWSQPFMFQGHWLSRNLEVQSGDKVGLSAHLDSVEPITTVDEAVFLPPPGATNQEIAMVGVKGNPIGMSGPYPNGANGDFSISGGVAQGLLVQRTPVEYPAVAKAARVQGTVVLQAIIDKEGHIKDLHVVSGMPLLQQAAIDAVQQWVYRPYIFNGKPVEVHTTVNVVFTLGGPPKSPSPSASPTP